MNAKIKESLEKLFNYNYGLIKYTSYVDVIDELLANNPNAYNLDKGVQDSLYDEKEIELLQESKENKVLIDSFDIAKARLNSKNDVIENFKEDILDSLIVINKKVIVGDKGFPCQLIFLEYDHDPVMCFCGFGPGDYPILDTPEYINFNYKEELFNGIGAIYLAEYWKEIIAFENELENQDEIEIIDTLWDSQIYLGFRNAIIYKTYHLLYKAFDQLPFEVFEGIPIKLPLFIYGNEHDQEAMNIYVYT